MCGRIIYLVNQPMAGFGAKNQDGYRDKIPPTLGFAQEA
jgi:hypothetical protein